MGRLTLGRHSVMASLQENFLGSLNFENQLKT